VCRQEHRTSWARTQIAAIHNLFLAAPYSDRSGGTFTLHASRRSSEQGPFLVVSFLGVRLVS
jgi:hypothetical protein